MFEALKCFVPGIVKVSGFIFSPRLDLSLPAIVGHSSLHRLSGAECLSIRRRLVSIVGDFW